MDNSYIKTEDHITMVFDDGDSATVYTTNPYFSKVVEAVSAQNWDEARRLAQPVEELKQTLADAKVTDRVSVEHGIVNFDGREMHNTLTSRMLDMLAEGFDVTPMARFMENLQNNPSNRSVTELYGFLEYSDLPITDDGCFVAYKRIADDYKDIYSGTMDNSIGQFVEMPRNEVDDDKDRTCSHGLHFCSREYLSSYGTRSGNRTVVVKINPADVVSIPVDYNNTKGRCCRYEVIAELEHMYEAPLEDAPLYTTEYDKGFDEEFESMDRESLENALDMIMSDEGLAVKQYDESGEWIGVYASPSEAEEVTGVNSSNIYKVIRGDRRSAGGYGWSIVTN